MANKTFLRQNANLLKKLGHKWRKPRGRQSKMRERRAGKAPVVTIGYGTANATRHIHPSGFREVLVFNKTDLANVSNETVVRISASVGARKRMEILNEAKARGLRVLNANEVKLRTIANQHSKKAKKTETKTETKKDAPAKKTEANKETKK